MKIELLNIHFVENQSRQHDGQHGTENTSTIHTNVKLHLLKTIIHFKDIFG